MARFDEDLRPRRSLPTAALLGLMGLALAACHDVAGNRGGEEGNVVRKLESLGLGEKLREIAIPVGDDLYMVPIGLDDAGCEAFKPHSENNPVKAAIHYRQADGGFGIARELAVCRVEMMPIGPDDDGCERFRAVPANADVSIEHEVVYYRTSDGAFSPRKPEKSCG